MKNVRVDEYGALEKSTDVTNLLVDGFKISTENNGRDASCTNGRNEIHNKSIHNMLRVGLIDINQNANKWCCAEETPEEFHRCKHNNSPHGSWYEKKPIIHEIRNFVCDIYPITSSPKTSYDRTIEG